MRFQMKSLMVMALVSVTPAFADAQESGSAGVDAARTDARWSMTYVVEQSGEAPPPGPVMSHSPWVTPEFLSPVNSPDVAVAPATNRTQSEISCAIHPTNANIMLVGANATNFPVTAVFGTGTYWSTNGGATWTGSDNPGGVTNRGDPSAAIGPDGRFMMGFISSIGGMGVAYSTNQGATWTQRSVSGASGLDKNHLMVDASAGSPFLGNYYNTWVNLGGGANVNDIEFSRSIDGGFTWTAPQNISNNVFAGSHNQGCNVQVGPNGEVYVAWSVYDGFPADEVAIGFNKSTNGGVSWLGETRKITGIRGHRNTVLPNTSIRRNSFPSMAVDVSNGPNRGAIYIVWTNIGVPGINTGTDASIWMAKSTNGGTTFSAATRVNNDAGTNSQWFPWISCDPVSGRLAVIFYDRRDDPANSLTRAYMAASSDGGATWDNFPVADVSFTPAPIPGLASGYMGDYLGIAVNSGKALPSWSDNRSGNFLCYVSPISLLDASDPNPPTAVSAFSDFSTPASVLLNWTDPTSFTDGTPLVDFSIDILRDGLLVANIDQGTGSHVDGGLTDGQLYAYSLRAHEDITDSVSTLVDVTVFAGGSPTPSAPANVTCAGGPASATIGWTNPATQTDGTRLDDFAGVRLYRNGAFLIELARAATDTGSADSYVDSPPPGFFYTYEVSAVDSESPVHESARVAAPPRYVGPVPEILVWQASNVVSTSGDSIVAALAALGEPATKVSDLFFFSSDLNAHQIVFAVGGVFPNIHVITTTEGAALDDFVQDGGRLYLEGSDCFNSAAGYNVRPIFGLAAGNNGTADLGSLSGENDLATFQFTYAGPNNSIDHLVPVQSTILFRNPANLDVVTVFNAPYVLGRSIGASYEFGGLRSPVFTHADLMAAYLTLFGTNGDPNPASNFAAFSDYATPSSALLTWTDPTTFRYGGPLVDFSIDVLRDGVLVANVDQGVGTHVDAGLTDGQLYAYSLRARDDVTDSLSTLVNATVFAGGSPTPAAPTSSSATATPVSATIGWTNPATQSDGTRLDDFAGVRLYRNGVFLIALARTPADTGDVDSYIDSPPPGTFYTYEISAIDSETPVHESTRLIAPAVYVGVIPDILVWKAANVSTASSDSIIAALAANGETAVAVSNLLFFSTDLNVHDIVFACAGVFPNNHIITSTEGAALDNFVQDGGRLYLEGGDCFNFDPTVGGYNVRTIFGLNAGANGTADLFAVTGLNDLAGFQFNYAGPNNRIDDLLPVQSTAVLRNSATSDVVTVFRSGYGQGRAIGAAFEFSGLTSATENRAALAAAYLEFFRASGAPRLAVSTDSLGAGVLQTQSAQLSFSVGNPGTPNATLSFAIAESPAASWLSFSPASGNVAANAATSISLTLNAGSLPPGLQSTKLIVTSNDPVVLADTVIVTMNVLGIPSLALAPDYLAVTVPVGGTSAESVTVFNAGFGSLDYTLSIIGIDGEDSEEFIEGTNSAALTAGWAGNVYTVATGVPLTSIEHLLNTPAPTELQFFVYEKPLQGTMWKKIASKTVTSGVGLNWYVSGPLTAVMLPSREYFVGCSWAGPVTAMRDDGTNVPDNTRFGMLTRSSQGFFYPPPESTTVGASGIIWSQIVRYGIPVDVEILSPLAGNLGEGEGDVIQFNVRNADQQGVYLALLNVFHNAPFSLPTVLPILIGVGESTTGVPADGASPPRELALHAAAPNPFRGETAIRYDLPQPSHVRIAIFDASGRLVNTMRDAREPAGEHAAVWNGTNSNGERVAPGVYFYSLEAGADSRRRKLVLLR
ncbi:MAG: FlgD immunoglobulin-like domain containing protein [bacterium]